jgi:hypothetical protein
VTVVLSTDRDWAVVDGEACRVSSFVPSARVDGGRVVAGSRTKPYASIRVESCRLPDTATGFITHRTDFLHLWSAFKDRGVGDEEEVIIFWTRQFLKRYARPVAAFMPRLWVTVCPKDAFKLITDPSFKPELTGLARWDAERPIAEWKPTVML